MNSDLSQQAVRRQRELRAPLLRSPLAPPHNPDAVLEAPPFSSLAPHPLTRVPTLLVLPFARWCNLVVGSSTHPLVGSLCCGCWQFAAVMARAARSPWFRKLLPAAADRYLARARAAWDYLTRVAPFGALCFHFYGCMGGVGAAEAVRPPHEHAYNCTDLQVGWKGGPPPP